jgi:hypothetical protein
MTAHSQGYSLLSVSVDSLHVLLEVKAQMGITSTPLLAAVACFRNDEANFNDSWNAKNIFTSD